MARWIDSWGILKLIVSKVNKYHQVQFFSNLETQNSKWMPQGSHQEWRDNWSRDLGIFHFSFQWNSLNLMFNYEISTKCFIYFFKGPSCRSLDFPVAQTVNNLPAMQETRVWSLGWEDPLEKGMASHSVFLPGESHGQRSLAGYSPWDRKDSDRTESLTYTHVYKNFSIMFGKRLILIFFLSKMEIK